MAVEASAGDARAAPAKRERATATKLDFILADFVFGDV